MAPAIPAMLPSLKSGLVLRKDVSTIKEIDEFSDPSDGK